MKQVLFCLALVFLVSGCNLGTSDATPLPTPDIPTIEILSPANNQQAYEGVEFDFDIVARDNNPGIARVELYIDDTLINSSTPVDDESVPVFRTVMNWRAAGVGRHIIEVIAYRPDGQQSDPARLNIEVLPRDE